MESKVGYKKWFGIFLVACSSIILATTLVIGVSINTFTGALLFIMGLLYLNNSAVVYTQDEIRIKNLYGMTLKTYSFAADKIEVKEGAVYANDKKIRIAQWILNKTEFDELLDLISAKRKN